MSLFFKGLEICERSKGLTFDDVLLMPEHSEMDSRRTPELKSRLTKKWYLQTPIISSNMDTVTGFEMAKTMAEMGAIGILHRFMTLEQEVLAVQDLIKYRESLSQKFPISASIGVKEKGRKRADALANAGVDILTIDIAHGDSVMMLDTLNYVKKNYPNIEVIAGNTATPGGTRRLIEAGADAIKVGIGPGSMCTTRIITGCGVPQLTAISLCSVEASRHDIPVIADGGIRTSGDMVKAFAAGAQTVMLGSMLAGTIETPGEVVGGMKKYRGMASKDAQVSWRGDLPQGMSPEGESRMIPCKGSVKKIIHELCGGIRSGMTYLNAHTISEISTNARFMEMGSSGVYESRPHGMNG